MKTLHDLGCDEMQGFLFGKPAPAADIELLLKESLSNFSASVS